MRSIHALYWALTTALVGLIGSGAHASDGVLEINQECATQTGCFPGDIGGFPVTITGSTPAKSFVLTSDLSQSDTTVTMIEIRTTPITIDLNGFSMRGGASCTPSGCGPFGGGDGIEIVDTAIFGLQVRNGTIELMGGDGIDAELSLEVENVRVAFNAGAGIRASNNARVTSVIAKGNAMQGITAGAGAVVSRSIAEDNQDVGIRVSGGSVVVDSAARTNEADGIQLNGDGVIRGCTAEHNTEDGIDGGAVLVVQSAAIDNGDGGNTDDGIECGAGCSVRSSVSTQNDGFGIRFDDANAAYSHNTITFNVTGPVNGGTPRGHNYCSGTGTIQINCP